MRHHLPGIDGLRALAVLGVIFFHLHVSAFFLGWSGVWLFFVISGFLITGILLEAKDRPFYFKNFYARRALRIFPIYFVCLGLLSVGAQWFAKRPVEGLGYYVFYVQNYYLASTHFEPAFPAAFNHTWSLAVEEQFYLFWPLVVRYATARVLKWICLLAIALAPLARFLLVSITGNPYTAITPLVADVDALAIGALIAVWLRGDPARVQKQLSNRAFKRGCEMAFLFLSLTLLAIILTHNPRNYWTPTKWLQEPNINIVLTSLLSTVFAILLLHFVLWDSWMRRLMENRWISHLGKISYGIYMFHGLVLTYAPAALGKLDPEVSTKRLALVPLTWSRRTYSPWPHGISWKNLS